MQPDFQPDNLWHFNAPDSDSDDEERTYRCPRCLCTSWIARHPPFVVFNAGWCYPGKCTVFDYCQCNTCTRRVDYTGPINSAPLCTRHWPGPNCRCEGPCACFPMCACGEDPCPCIPPVRRQPVSMHIPAPEGLYPDTSTLTPQQRRARMTHHEHCDGGDGCMELCQRGDPNYFPGERSQQTRRQPASATALRAVTASIAPAVAESASVVSHVTTDHGNQLLVFVVLCMACMAVYLLLRARPRQVVERLGTASHEYLV
jgi:hypothetical protein